MNIVECMRCGSENIQYDLEYDPYYHSATCMDCGYVSFEDEDEEERDE